MDELQGDVPEELDSELSQDSAQQPHTEARAMTDLSPPDFGADATRAALETLSRDQRDLIRSWLSGFEDREGLLRWCHEASVLTLGYLDREWHLERLMSGSELSSHIVTEQRFRGWTRPRQRSSPSTRGSTALCSRART